MDKPNKKYGGVIVPMVSPVNEDLTIDTDAVHRILDLLINAGVSPFLLGTNGESVSISDAQKLVLVENTVSYVNKKITVFAGISGNCLEESIRNARLYAQTGADVVVAHLPFYFPLTSDHMLNYYEQLADRIPCPLIIYNNPVTVKQSIPLDIIEQLSHHPNIAGLKDSERGMERLNRALELWRYRDDFVHLLGWTVQSAYSLLNGSDGIVPSTGNFIPSLYKDLYDAALRKDEYKSFEYQHKADRISDIYIKDRNISKSIPALKYIMSLKGLCKPFVLPPLSLPDKKEQNAIKEMVIAELGIPGST
ncbi:MAG: dihydrodipicolinate synthase family protein [Bacteroidales bacterium]|nr:dihydrodipicolinate synthase family protein [Bacteroidales bacterium]